MDCGRSNSSLLVVGTAGEAALRVENEHRVAASATWTNAEKEQAHGVQPSSSPATEEAEEQADDILAPTARVVFVQWMAGDTVEVPVMLGDTAADIAQRLSSLCEIGANREVCLVFAGAVLEPTAKIDTHQYLTAVIKDATFPLGGFCKNVDGIAISPDGDYALVSNRMDNNVGIVNLSTAALTFPEALTLPRPGQLAIAPCGTYALVAANGPSANHGKEVVRIDISTCQIDQRYPGFDGPYGVAIAPCGTFALIGNVSGRNVGYIDMQCGQVTFPYTGFVGRPHGVAIAPCGSFALVSNFDTDNVAKIDLGSGNVSFPYKVLKHPQGISISPCGTFALTTNWDTGQLSRIDLISDQITQIQISERGVVTRGISIAPCGTYAVFTNAIGKLFRLDL